LIHIKFITLAKWKYSYLC